MSFKNTSCCSFPLQNFLVSFCVFYAFDAFHTAILLIGPMFSFNSLSVLQPVVLADILFGHSDDFFHPLSRTGFSVPFTSSDFFFS